MVRGSLRLVRAAPPERAASSSAPPPFDDARLLAAIGAGDEESATELHDRLRPRVDRTIRALLGGGHSDHDDLAQQSFVEILLSLGRYRGECALETWAATIAARVVFKFLRRRTSERRVFTTSTVDVTDVEPAGPGNLQRQLVARDLASRIRRLLETIEPAKAEAFLLHDVCGFEAREIAAIAGTSEAATHARIARGRRELRERLADDPELHRALRDLGDEP